MTHTFTAPLASPAIGISLLFYVPPASAADLPIEPMDIGTQPQFFVDDTLVDNRWALKQKTEEVLRVAHQPVKHAGNPVIAGEGGYVSVAHDEEAGLFRLWYQTHERGGQDEERTAYGIAYAESKDGLAWTLPKLGLPRWQGGKEDNIVWRGVGDMRASGQHVLTLPAPARRGYRYVMAYHGTGRGGARAASAWSARRMAFTGTRRAISFWRSFRAIRSTASSSTRRAGNT